MDSFSEQVAARMLGIHKVVVRYVVNQAPIDLLRYILIEGSVSCLHVEYGDLHPLGHNGGNGTVCITQDEECVGLLS